MIQSGLALDIVRYKMINESPLPHCPDVPFVPIIRRTYCFIKIPLYFSMQLQGFILSGGIKFDVDNSPLLSTQFMYKLMHNKPV